MAYHLIEHRKKFAGRRVLELGAGALGIAGIALAVASDAAEVVLTVKSCEEYERDFSVPDCQ